MNKKKELGPPESYRNFVVEFFDKQGTWGMTAKYKIKEEHTVVFNPSKDKIKKTAFGLLKKDITNSKTAWQHAVVKFGERGVLITRKEYDEELSKG